MNLLSIPDCPIAEDDLEALLRALLHAKETGHSISFDYHPAMKIEPKWHMYLHQDGKCVVGRGQTLEAAIEEAFKAARVNPANGVAR